MKASSDHLIPLCHPQRRVWISELMHPGTGVGNLAGCLHFPGSPAQLPVLAEAIDRVVGRHDALRLRLARTSSSICAQYLGEGASVHPPIMEVDETRLALLEESRKPFALFDAPLHLFRLLTLPGDRIGFYFKYHHIIIDAWTVSLLNRQIQQTFEALSGSGTTEPDESASYLDFLDREQRYLDSRERVDDEEFWRKHLQGLDDDRSPTRHPVITTRRSEHTFDPSLSADIETFCRHHQTTVFRFFLAVFALHFAGRSYDRDIVLSTGHHNRLDPREKAMAGMTVSTLPIRLPIRADDTFEGLLQRVHIISSACLSHQKYPYDLLSQHMRTQGHDPLRMLRYFVNHIPSLPETGHVRDYTVERYSPGSDLAELNFKINPNQRPRSAPLQLCVDARTAMYDEQSVATLFARIEQIAREAIARSDRRIVAMDLLTAQERHTLVSAPRHIFEPTSMTFPEAFEEAAGIHAGQVALVDDEGPRTYARLLAESSALAAELLRCGIRNGDRVAIVSDRGSLFVVAALAIMRVGAAWVPITPDTPLARMTQILGDAGVSLVLVDSRRSESKMPVRVIGDHVAGPGASLARVRPGDAAYVIYTSGSTGTPKGVMIPHRALMNLCTWNADLCGIGEGVRTSAFCSFMFDVSVAELLTPLLRGATVYIVPSSIRSSVHELGRFLDQNEIAVATLPTRVGELFLAHVRVSSLRVLTVAGEKLHASVKSSYRLINAYGPTETTVFATVYEVQGGEAEIPIGRPVANTWAYVVDEHDRPVAQEEGELLLAGDQIALGYLNRPDLTCKAFITNPFKTCSSNAIAYRTGDLVRALPDGNLLFRGRRDRQIKVRGFRIEPDEIERCLESHPEVARAFVMRNEETLVAFCVSRNDTLDEASLRDHARALLPEFMVPSLVLVPEIPLLANGKTDLSALGRRMGNATKGSGAIPPRDETEGELLRLFRAVLHRDGIGVTDSFFEMGGDSITAMQLFAEIEDEVLAKRIGEAAPALPVSLIFENPTVASLARAISFARADHEVDNVVVMKHGSGDRCLFCIHDFTGDLMSYTSLLKHLGEEVSVRGIRWCRRASDCATLEDVALHYIRGLRASQPTGPYHLLGYSIGGTIAFEMARQLLASGEGVAFLGLVDTPNYTRDTEVFEKLFLTVTRSILSWIRGISLSHKLAFIRSNVGRISSRERIMEGIRAQRQMRRIAMQYRPGPIACDILLFKSEGRRIGLDDCLGWRDLATSIELHLVEGDHISMLNERNARHVARPIREILNPPPMPLV